MRMVGRLLLLLIAAAMLAFGIWRERHIVHPLGEGEAQSIPAHAFVQGTTEDRYMLKGGQLFDIYSLSKTTAGEKDCKT